ncbi:uncharacterized protein BJ171DRAFT_488925 [Polychytrium aggregatum]|uniref:uncharacterized protein n=1 Tax=Polychytrium aggregatum TaxID=110093 RepID=UPI0022FF2446|nr:uncharacterized protein BJ171DRAFT_488925 [Polychytrium aggregatum]KAI9208450.1 hypothetical protein BJ171DRAFT_488925 [Polychytrium aggregatum]
MLNATPPGTAAAAITVQLQQQHNGVAPNQRRPALGVVVSLRPASVTRRDPRCWSRCWRWREDEPIVRMGLKVLSAGRRCTNPPRAEPEGQSAGGHSAGRKVARPEAASVAAGQRVARMLGDGCLRATLRAGKQTRLLVCRRIRVSDDLKTNHSQKQGRRLRLGDCSPHGMHRAATLGCCTGGRSRTSCIPTKSDCSLDAKGRSRLAA